MAPFLPFTAEKIEHQFKFKPDNWTHAATQWRFESGVSIAEPTLLFEKITDETVAQQMEKLHQNNPSQSIDEVTLTINPAKAEIDFETFQKIDLRVGTILTAERVPKTDKLMQLTVDIGLEQRTIVSGIAHQFAPETLIGAKTIVLINLAPRKIKGITSQGMLLLAENEKGELSLMQPQADLSPGSSIS